MREEREEEKFFWREGFNEEEDAGVCRRLIRHALLKNTSS